MNLKDKTCVITGGAKGIGLALAELLVGQGAKVLVADVDEAAADAVAERLGREHVQAVRCDVSLGKNIRAAGEAAVKAFGRLDVWVNNAGLARHRWIADYSEAEIDAMLGVNLKGTILGSQEALRHMTPQKSGHIVNIISTASLRGIPSETVYCAAKWGVRGFTQGLQEEAAAYGIRVTAVLPGGVDTAFWDEASQRKAPVEKFLTPVQVAQGVISVLQMDDWCVARELVLRSLADSDFSVSPQ